MTNSIIQSLLWTVAIVHVLGQRYVLPYLTAVFQQLFADVSGEPPVVQPQVAPVLVTAKPVTATVSPAPKTTTPKRRKRAAAVTPVAVA